jgi:hypothetical protein
MIYLVIYDFYWSIQFTDISLHPESVYKTSCLANIINEILLDVFIECILKE